MIVMKVHITCTPEFSSDVVKEVVSILNKTKGYLEFSFAEPLTNEEISLINPKFNTPQTIEYLTFDEFFRLCQYIRAMTRRTLNIQNDEYVVMITSIPNQKDWFSAFQEKDIFIYGLDWEYYTKHDEKFGIAYQVVENIFQSQIKLNIDDVDNEPNIHIPSIGCIDDMCMEKVDVMFKLRTADICDSCIDRAIENKVESLLLQHIIHLIEGLRQEFVSSNRVASKLKPEMVHVESDRTIKIGDREFEPWPIQKLLFIFFLKNKEGVETKFICDYQDELYEIYDQIRHPADILVIQNLFNKNKIGDPSFSINKTKLNKALKELLGKQLADFYLLTRVVIENGKRVYKIGLEDKYIKIDPKG
jgi:hypothetical protein